MFRLGYLNAIDDTSHARDGRIGMHYPHGFVRQQSPSKRNQTESGK